MDDFKKMLKNHIIEVSDDVIKLPTSIPSFDIFIGGGIGKHLMTYVWGVSGTGKTTLMMQVLYSIYKRLEMEDKKGIFVVLDTEEGIVSEWFKRINIKFDYIRLEPMFIEDIEIIIKKIRDKYKDGELYVLWDSVASTPPANITGRGDVARAVSNLLRNLQISKLGMTFFVINQYREKQDKFSQTEPPSGNYLKHNSSLTLFFSSYSKSKFFTTRPDFGRSVLFKIQKNRIGFNSLEYRFEMNNFSGFDSIFPILLVLREFNILSNHKGVYKINLEDSVEYEIDLLNGTETVDISIKDFITNIDFFNNLQFENVKELYKFMLEKDSVNLWELGLYLTTLKIYNGFFFEKDDYFNYVNKLYYSVMDNYFFTDRNFVDYLTTYIKFKK